MPPRLTVCRAGLHDLTDPANVGARRVSEGVVYRWCLPCQRARRNAWSRERRRQRAQLEWTGPHRRTAAARRMHRIRYGIPRRTNGSPILYRITDVEHRVLQLAADGLTLEEVAEAMFMTPESVRRGVLYKIRLKYGVETTAAAVAQGLKRGLLSPDRTAAKLIRRNRVTRDHARSVVKLINDGRPQYHAGRRLETELDALCAWTEAHAVSVLWAAGLITSRHVPQTRNRYRGFRDQRPRHESETTMTRAEHATAA